MVFLNLLLDITNVLDNIGAKTGTFNEMATGGSIALPEPLDGEDAKSWFKRYMNRYYGTPFVTKIHSILGLLLTYKESLSSYKDSS